MKLEAKNARILLAEDNEINREVVIDILEPLCMHIDTAENGKEALDMAVKNHYDLILMDYLMPELNGAEATYSLRHIEGREDLHDIPVIALTASADETDKLLDSGMNDYIIKPLSYNEAVEMFARWLPTGMLYATADTISPVSEEEEIIEEIAGIDLDAGVTNSGSRRLLKKLFSDYEKVIEWKASQIENLLKEQNYEAFRVEVHALKSSSNLVGATDLSKCFEEIEKKIKNNDLNCIEELTKGTLSEYRNFKAKLKKYSLNKHSNSLEVSNQRVISILNNVISDANCFYLDGVDNGIHELDKCVLPLMIKEDFEKLRMLVSDVSMENAVKLAKEMIDKLKS